MDAQGINSGRASIHIYLPRATIALSDVHGGGARRVGVLHPTGTLAGAVCSSQGRPKKKKNINPAQAPILQTFEAGGVHRCVGTRGKRESIDIFVQVRFSRYHCPSRRYPLCPRPPSRKRLSGSQSVVFFPMKEITASITSILHAFVRVWRI